MKKTLPVNPLPDRKKSFENWVEQIRSSNYPDIKFQEKPLIKSVYIRKTGKNLNNTIKNWDKIQNISWNKYQEKIVLMENIRERKLENQTINLICTPRFACSTIIGSK
jgi:hypothetical protein